MRMRKKRHLEERMERCGSILIARGSPEKNLKHAAETFRALIDYRETFGNDFPVCLEVGCGNGKFVAELAKREREKNFLAVELCTNVILTAMERVRAENIPNVRFLNIPAEILPCYLPARSVETVYLNFSTPLPNRSEERQRLTSPRFLELYRDVLADGGTIVQKTDSEPFFDYSLEKFAECGFEVVEVTRDLHHSAWAKENIVTEYEQNFVSRGLPIFRAVARLK